MAEIAGLKLIVPSSVTNSGGSSSVSATGKVTFSGITTSLSINGVFSASYDNYLIVYRGTNSTGAGGDNLRLRASGSDASGNDYVRQFLFANNTSVTGGRVTLSFANATTTRTSAAGSHIYLYGPAIAQPTAMRSLTVASNGSDDILYDFASTHSLSTAYDGFTLLPASNYPTTGALTVYGLAQ